MNNLEKLKLYENWLQRGIDLQKSGKGNLLGYENELTSNNQLPFKTINMIGQDYVKLCKNTFYNMGIEHEKNSGFLTELSLLSSSYLGEFALIRDDKFSLDFVIGMKQGIFESSLDSLTRNFPELKK
jgi:hypothetical protein